MPPTTLNSEEPKKGPLKSAVAAVISSPNGAIACENGSAIGCLGSLNQLARSETYIRAHGHNLQIH